MLRPGTTAGAFIFAASGKHWPRRLLKQQISISYRNQAGFERAQVKPNILGFCTIRLGIVLNTDGLTYRKTIVAQVFKRVKNDK